LLKSQREALRLHGLSERQIESIGNDGKLLSELKIVAPDIDRHQDDEELRLSQVAFQSVAFVKTNNQASDLIVAQPLVIDQLYIHKGQAVTAGETLCSLSDYTHLFIVGKAFEEDVLAISNALQQGWKVDAIFPSFGGRRIIEGLKLAYVDNSIDPASRTLSFYVELPNEVVRDEVNGDAQRFIAWQHRVGQRLEVRVPVERWENQLVLPVEAVVKEGPDWFVFQQNGNRFERIAVHVQHRDQTSVVVANDGSIFPGDVIAIRSAHQLQMAVKNRTGTPVDPHAGHNH
jgi:hypothetical protein